MAETTEEIIIKVEAEGAEKTTEQLEDLADSLKKTDKETKKYTKTLGDSAKEVKIFGTSLGGLKGGFSSAIGQIKNSVKGLKSFRLALAGTGIGLIVIALGAMALAISKSEKAMDTLTDAFDVVKTVIEVLIGVVAQLGDSLLSLFSGDFQEAFDKASAAFDNLGERIVENVQLTLALNDANRKLEVQLIRNSVQIAKNNAEIAEQKRIADDTTKAIGERVIAAERAATLISRNARLETAAAKEALRIRREAIESDNETNGIALKTREQQAELAALEIAEIQAIQQEEERLLEISNKTNSLRLQQDKEFIELKKGIYDIDISNSKTAEDKKIIDIRAGAKEAVKISNQEVKEKQKAYDQDVANKKIASSQNLETGIAFANAASSIAAAFGGDSKQLAAFQATIQTASGIAKTIGTLGFPAAIPFVIAAAAAGAAQIAAILSTPTPTAKTYGSGGLLQGNSHANGGVMINAEGGEAVINKRSSLMFRKELSAINQAGGGVPFMRLGGVVPTAGATTSPFIDLEKVIQQSRGILVTEDLQEAQSRINVTEALTTL